MYKYFLLIFILISCGRKDSSINFKDPEPVVVSLLGREFFEPERPLEVQARLDSNLLAAKKNFETEPSEENFIWYGRREGYLSHFKQAIKIFSDGIAKYPDAYRLFRHRGHRYISVRDFDRAVADLQQAAALMPRQSLEIEPDGQPNRLDTPLSTTQFNVWYHLGLAHYLKRDFESAERAFVECMEVSTNDDLICATADWLYMTYRKIGKTNQAEELLLLISDSMNIIENDSYHKRLLLYKGLLRPDDVLNVDINQEDADLALATQGYGVGNWYLYSGDTIKAKSIFERVVAGKYFSAFGFIAAEAELVGMNELKSE